MYVDGCGRANTQIRGRRDGIVRDGVVEHRVYFCTRSQQEQLQQSTDSDDNGDECDSDETDKDDGGDDDDIKKPSSKTI